jgi:hypothetical protein
MVLFVDDDVLAVVRALPALHIGIDGLPGQSFAVRRLADVVLVLLQGVRGIGHRAAPRVVVWPLHRLQLALDVELLARFEQEDVQPMGSEDVGGHTTGGARADDDGIVGALEVDVLRRLRRRSEEGHREWAGVYHASGMAQKT